MKICIDGINGTGKSTLISLLKKKGTNIVRNCIVTIVVGLPVIYFIGSVYLYMLTKMGIKAILASAVLPFIPLDIVKCIVASILAKPIKQAVDENYTS